MTMNPLASAATPPLHPRPNLTISPAEIAHAPALQAMVRDAYTKYIDRIGKPPAPMNTDYSKLIASETQSVFILRRRDEDEANGDGDGDGGEIIVGSIVLGLEDDVGEEEEEEEEDVVVAVVKINNVVVGTGHQGKGYGRVLMEFAEEAAKGLVLVTGNGKKKVEVEGAKTRAELRLFTNVMMWENLKVYPKMGFDEVGRRHEDGYERVFYRKVLN